MPVGLFPREAADIQAPTLDGGTSAPPQPGFFQGAFGALGSGIEEGAVKAVLATPDLPPSPPIGAPDWAYTQYEQQLKERAAIAPAQRQAELARDTTQVLQQFRSDPHTVGFAGQMLHGLSSGLTRFVGGTLATGSPIGGAVVVGGSEGVATSRELQAQGVDENTANAIGSGTALFAGAGSLLPGGYGVKAATRLLTGAAANTGQGMAQRGLTHVVLADAGYTAQAHQYQALDGTAMVADAVLGAGFGAAHHLFTPSMRDAAHTALDADHVETSAPGVPPTPQARDAHVANMDVAAEALLRGDDTPPSLRDVETVPNPAQDALGETRAADMADAGREATGETGEPPARPQERRADQIAAARLTELRLKGDERTPEESTEYTRLLEADRLQAKVGGRAIRGLRSREAYEEMVARGEAQPSVGYFDLDMFKDINDKFGMDQGDEAIRAAGEAAASIAGEGNAFKGSERAGDEFAIQGKNDADVEAKIQAIRQHLANHTIELYDNAGNLIASRKGLDFSHGIGRTIDEAAAASKITKQERAKLGFRAERGAVPAQVRQPGGESSGETPAGTEAAAVASRFDPETQEALAQAQAILARRGDMQIPGEAGAQSAKEALDAAVTDAGNAASDSALAKVAAACFGRG